jgi:hypothetical protein
MNTAHLESGEVLREIHNQCPVIPGMRVKVDLKNKSITIHDPLLTDEAGKKVWERLSLLIEKHKGKLGISKPAPDAKVDFTPDNLKETLYWMKRATDGGEFSLAEVVRNSINNSDLPSYEEIAELPGKRKAQPFWLTESKLDDEDRYVDVVDTTKKVSV